MKTVIRILLLSALLVSAVEALGVCGGVVPLQPPQFVCGGVVPLQPPSK